MKSIIVLFLLSGILISGCITSPTEQIPVVKVNLTLSESGGVANATSFTFSQGTVEFVKRPKHAVAESFPAITARTIIVRSNATNVTWIGPWETLAYNGNGTYSFNAGFDEKHYPTYGDLVQISVMVVDKNGGRMGSFKELFTWNLK